MTTPVSASTPLTKDYSQKASMLPIDAPPTLIYQRGKLYGQRPAILRDFAQARDLLADGLEPGRIVGSSGGALPALAHAITLAARREPERFAPEAAHAIDAMEALLRAGRPRALYRVNWGSLIYGLHQPGPLRRWLDDHIRVWLRRPDGAAPLLSEIGYPLYLAAGDRDGFPVFFGPQDEGLRRAYYNCTVRTEDAPIVDACIAALSTLFLFDAVRVNGAYYKDLRPGLPDLSATLIDMQQADPRPLIAVPPEVEQRRGQPNLISQGLFMHRWMERNTGFVTRFDAALAARITQIEQWAASLGRLETIQGPIRPGELRACHPRIEYLTSTQMLEDTAIASREYERFIRLGAEVGGPQIAQIDLSQPYNVFYGAGGLSAVLICVGLIGEIQRKGQEPVRISGCSAGLMPGLFHAVTLAAKRHPHLYRPEALHALDDLAALFAGRQPSDIFTFNWLRPRRLWRGLADLRGLRANLTALLEKYTGVPDGSKLRFSDMQLPFWPVASSNPDGYPAVFGMPDDLVMRFDGEVIRPIDAPVVDAVIAGASLPLFAVPGVVEGREYVDGGASIFDHSLIMTLMDPQPRGLLSVHLGEPTDYSFGYPERPPLLRSLYDTHSYMIPEQRRRVHEAVNRFYAYLRLRARARALRDSLSPAERAARPTPDLESAWWQP